MTGKCDHSERGIGRCEEPADLVPTPEHMRISAWCLEHQGAKLYVNYINPNGHRGTGFLFNDDNPLHLCIRHRDFWHARVRAS